MEETKAREGENEAIAGDEGAINCTDHPFKPNPGGICAFCLQEKLGNLLTSSSSTFPLPLSFSSPSHSLPSLPPNLPSLPTESECGTRRSRISFLKRSRRHSFATVLQRSRSTAASHKRPSSRLWSLFHFSRGSARTDTATAFCDPDPEPNEYPPATFGQKVGRSRSVGCGSRSFSGDLLDRISTGFGDCTLRRVESQREPKVRSRKMRCGGLFGGFVTSSSSSSSSSSYWGSEWGGKGFTGRARSWTWAIASPIRAFGKQSSKKGKKEVPETSLVPIPSLLSVRG